MLHPSHPDPAGYRALIHAPGTRHIEVLDQRTLPHLAVRTRIGDAGTAALAIRGMWVRGAPLIGVVGAFGLAMALDRDATDGALARAFATLVASRPTAVNLAWALDRLRRVVAELPLDERADAAWREADLLCAEDTAINHAIGVHGLALLRDIAARKPGPVNVMTHCNAGALAATGWGTATAPMFLAHNEGLPLHVWVSETRPRLQGANLTAWEMSQRRLPYTLFPDAASALLMQRGDVDVIIVGADRVAANGDVCNKIGTYEKALAAHDNSIPFHVALPSPTLDASLPTGAGIPIETRGADEVLEVTGRDSYGQTTTVAIAPPGAHAVNYAFDLTPARLVSGLITERGIVAAAQPALAAAFPERYA
jgi:methylthioribose-1-phosphate isomerase